MNDVLQANKKSSFNFAMSANYGDLGKLNDEIVSCWLATVPKLLYIKHIQTHLRKALHNLMLKSLCRVEYSNAAI